MTNFNEMMKFLRTSRNVTQSELARAIGVSPSAVGMYETGERQPNFEIEEKIADYFNVSLDTLRGKQITEPPIDYEKLSDINKEKLKAYYQAFLDTQEK